MKQKRVTIVEVDDINNLKKVVESKYELVKNYLFLLKKKNKEIEDFLIKKGLNFFVLNSENEKIIYKEKKVFKPKKSKIFDNIIRSGVEIKEEGHLVFLERINPGAKIIVNGNIEILDENQGLIICEGDYLLVNKNKGTIIFNSEDIGRVDKITAFFKDKKKVIK